MKRKIYLSAVIVLLIVISNVFFILYSSLATFRIYDYQAIETDFKYQSIPAKGHNLERMLEVVKDYDQLNSTHTTICRKFSINYLKFWQWYDYYSNPYYKFPKCPDES